MSAISQIREICHLLQKGGVSMPEVGIVLGTGLGNLASKLNAHVEVPYSSLPGFPLSTVESHSGKFIYGTLSGKKVIAMQGRFHFYEGYSLEQIVLPVRIMKMLGINYLLLSNAAGAVNLKMKKGSLMLLDDHISLLPSNPLMGRNQDELGPRFPDMSEPYSKQMNEGLMDIASQKQITLNKGVYAAVPGPMLETRAEYRYLHSLGADAVGMSTVPEVIAANHMGLSCAAVSVLTDECDPDDLHPVSIEEIIAVAAKAEEKLSELFMEFIKKF